MSVVSGVKLVLGAAVLTVVALAGGGAAADSEALAVLKRFQAMAPAGVTVHDDFNFDASRRITGPVGLGPGVKSATDPADKAALFPEDQSPALHIYYGSTIRRRGRLALDFKVQDPLPKDHSFMTLLSAGTPGNTKFWVRVGMDRRVSVGIMPRRESITLLGDPVTVGQWHHLDWWFAAEGSVLAVDGAIHDYSTDVCVPYAVEAGEASHLGAQPWWDAGGHKGIFYARDNFVGSIDNLELVGLKP